MVSDRRPETVLIVEDEPRTSEATEVMLTEIDISDVFIASSFVEAEMVLENRAFDLAILDFEMGEAASWSIARRLCDQGTKIIITTRRDALSLPASCREGSVLRKP